MLLTIVGALIGAVFSIATTIFVELLRRPRFKFAIETPALPPQEYPPDYPFKSARYLRISVTNAPLPFFAKWMMRLPALQCRAIISFHHLDGQNVFGRSMAGRWSGSPEPVSLPIAGPDGKIVLQMIDLSRLTLASRIDIYPGEAETLDIVLRPDDDPECYGWNNEAYSASPRWRNPAWKLDRGRYLAAVQVTSSGRASKAVFRIVNDVPRTDFRLELATRREARSVRW